MLVRRGVAIAAAVVLFILLALLINACRSNARENALKDYNREASSIGRDSETQVGQPFFALLSGEASESPTDLQTQVASLRVEAEKQFERAEDIDVPDEMIPAQRSLLILLELRRDGLDLIGQRVRAALGDDGDAADQATQSITGQMQSFLASDVLHRGRVVPLITSALNDAEIGGQEIASSRFVPSPEWLQPAFVADRLGGGGGGSGGSGASADDEPEPGTHGTGLESVAVGDITLTADGSNRLPRAAPRPSTSSSPTRARTTRRMSASTSRSSPSRAPSSAGPRRSTRSPRASPPPHRSGSRGLRRPARRSPSPSGSARCRVRRSRRTTARSSRRSSSNVAWSMIASAPRPGRGS
jgi:hypothetical protein